MSSNFRSWGCGGADSTVSTWLPSYLSHASYYQNTWTQHVSDALKETSHAKNLNEQENISGVFIAKMENRFCKTHPTEKSLVDRSVLITLSGAEIGSGLQTIQFFSSTCFFKFVLILRQTNGPPVTKTCLPQKTVK